jgi:pimeloyl-ACP methyl ester carboxylesterase
MRTKHLIIVPGLSSPFEEKYIPVYGLLTEEATLRRGFGSCEVLLLPGQMNENQQRDGQLSLPDGLSRLLNRISELESNEQPYRLLGLSFGSVLCLAALVENRSLRHLEKVVCWGPSPFWSSWNAFVRGAGREKLAKSTTLDDREFFRTLVPVECLLDEPYPTLIAAGSEDPYCPPYFLNYLWNTAQAAGRRNIQFASVTQCAHNVTRKDSNWQDYVSVVLN